jgi:hypothetical protein
MGLMAKILDIMFGNGRNLIGETAGIFSENTDAAARRAVMMQQAALAQFGAEFGLQQKGRFDRLIDGLNRLPRPGMALGTLALFIAAMVDPEWFTARMEGLALVPEPLWWLLGAIVSFYFGARHQAKGQAFQERVLKNIAKSSGSQHVAAPLHESPDVNPVLQDWRDRDLAPRY